MAIKVNLHKLEFAGPLQRKITAEACKNLEEALNHPEFNRKVLAGNFTASWQRIPGVRDEQKSVQKIAQLILDGKEQGTNIDNEIDLHIRYRRLWRAIGTTNLGQFPITTSYRFVNKCIRYDDSASLAAHFMHEWMHVAGFYHFGGNGARGDVAYVIGDIVHDVIIDNIESNKKSEMQ